jgi:tetratricopeptide (TPR) repeat protein
MSATPPLPHVSTGLSVAREHVQKGRLQEAEQAYRQVLAENPVLPEALRFLANAALAHGRPAEAVDLLSRALESDRNDPDMLLELGAAYRAGDRPDAARYVLERAVELSGSRRPSARLMLASVLEDDQRPELALLQYFRAILDAQGAGQWLDDQSTEPGLRGLVKHAMGFVANGRREWFDRAMQPLRTHESNGALDRIDRAVSIYLHESAESPGDPRQKPTFLFVPSLGTGPFIDPASLPWLGESTRRIAGLGAELAALAGSAAAPATSPFNLQSLLGGDQAPAAAAEVPQRAPVYQHGTLVDEAKAHAPRLVAALEDTPLVRIPWHGPDAEVVTLAPGDRTSSRSGRTNSRIAVAVAPSDSAEVVLEVGGERATLRPSRALAFDPTYGYAFANHGGGTARLVLFEVWHPGLSPAERGAVEAVTAAAVEFDSRLYELS